MLQLNTIIHRVVLRSLLLTLFVGLWIVCPMKVALAQGEQATRRDSMRLCHEEELLVPMEVRESKVWIWRDMSTGDVLIQGNRGNGASRSGEKVITDAPPCKEEPPERGGRTR